MDVVERARKVLSDAEGALRRLIEQALLEQKYAELAQIAGLADGLARLADRRQTTTTPTTNHLTSTESMPGLAKQVRTKRLVGKTEKNNYPRFERDGERLVKIGWSKKNKSSYEHRAPREAVVAFVRHLTNSVPEGTVFVVEDLMPIPDFANGGEFPAYQFYLTLAWLRHVGTIEKKGRDGYVIRPGTFSDKTLDKLWSALPAKAS